MERIAYPGEAALWELARREREPAAGRIVPPAASGANGLRSQYPRLVSISARLESTSYCWTRFSCQLSKSPVVGLLTLRSSDNLPKL